MGSLQFPIFLLVVLNTAVLVITEEVIHMGMFPEVADYSFYNCRKEMLQMVTKAGGLLETEIKNNTLFETMWQDNAECDKAIPGGTPEHMAALRSYAEAPSKFYNTFKKSLHTKSRGSSYRDDFPFKSLFFLLTDAMHLLKSDCRTVYSGKEAEYSTNIGDKVRFASFFQAKQKYTEATEVAVISENIGTVFNITSCSAINLDEMCGSEDTDIELLISPTEVFKVTNIRNVSTSNDQYKEITLMNSGFHSSSNCRGLVSVSEDSKESSSSFPSSSLLSLMASLLVTYFSVLTL
ncbi:erythroblast NAD(P)(+)--arginine ADP-ribosyltransferase isoform X2 [Megalobrama amblycephala]|nr:erythroblast NAD(P)(+)--arginine ADP-ribosyltransferase isoform X2 [Megalobrama amblycephala]